MSGFVKCARCKEVFPENSFADGGGTRCINCEVAVGNATVDRLQQQMSTSVVSLVVWSPYKGDIPGHVLREAINEIEVDRLAADIPDGLSPVAALGAVCKPLGWTLYIRKNGGARWQTETGGAEVDQQGVLSIDTTTDPAIASKIRDNYAVKATTIPGAKFSMFICRDMRRRNGLTATEAGSTMLVPTDKCRNLEKLQHVVQQFGATFAVVPVPDASVFMVAALTALAKEIETLKEKATLAAQKAWQAAQGKGRVKAYTEETLILELKTMHERLIFWSGLLDADPAEEELLIIELQKQIKDSFAAVTSYRNSRNVKEEKNDPVQDIQFDAADDFDAAIA